MDLSQNLTHPLIARERIYVRVQEQRLVWEACQRELRAALPYELTLQSGAHGWEVALDGRVLAVGDEPVETIRRAQEVASIHGGQTP